jgi:hypothetical protein
MGFTHFQIEQNPWLGGYRPQVPVLSVNWICWTPNPKKKIPGYATGYTYIYTVLVYMFKILFLSVF